VQSWCRACRELADPTVLPVRRARQERPHYQVAAGLIWKGEKLLIAQRQAESMLGGLWEFPGGKQEGGESLEQCLAREIREELGIEIRVFELLLSLDHAYSHLRITLHVYRARYERGRPRALGCAAWRWVTPAELPVYAFSRADGRVIEQRFPELGKGAQTDEEGRA
jgi:A/G-specific adenine glycosylase